MPATAVVTETPDSSKLVEVFENVTLALWLFVLAGGVLWSCFGWVGGNALDCPLGPLLFLRKRCMLKRLGMVT